MSKTAFLSILFIFSFCLSAFTGCTGTTGQATNSPGAGTNSAGGANSGDPTVGRVPHSGGECAEGGGEPATAINSPTEAYTFLFDAVKRKDTAAIKQISSKATREMAQIMNTSYKKTCEEAYKNGFTETTLQEKMPQIRDLRTEGDVAAMEVKNPKGVWEDVPFIKEGNGWKLALGDLFFGRIKSPGKSQTIREQENANARGVGNMPINPLANKNGANGNAFKAVPVPNEKIEKQLLKKRQPGAPKQ